MQDKLKIFFQLRGWRTSLKDKRQAKKTRGQAKDNSTTGPEEQRTSGPVYQGGQRGRGLSILKEYQITKVPEGYKIRGPEYTRKNPQL